MNISACFHWNQIYLCCSVKVSVSHTAANGLRFYYTTGSIFLLPCQNNLRHSGLGLLRLMRQKEKLKEYLTFKFALLGAKNNYLIIGKPPCQCPMRLWGYHRWRRIIWVLSLSPFLFPGAERIEVHTTWKPFRSIYQEIFFSTTDVYRLIGFDSALSDEKGPLLIS